MESRGIRLAKEDSMTVDGAILTANSHGDKFCQAERADNVDKTNLPRS